MENRTEPSARARSGAVPVSERTTLAKVPASQLAPAFEMPPAGDYQLDPDQSAITFTTRHLFGLGAVDGSFKLASGQIHVDGSLPNSWASLTVQAGSFATGNPSRDLAVRSARLLATGSYPDITFISTALQEANGALLLHGRLSVRGHDGPAEVSLRSSRWDGSLLQVQATATVDRYAFGVTAARGLAGRHLDLLFDIAARPATAPGQLAWRKATP